MLLWLVFALLSAGALAVLVRPLLRPGADASAVSRPGVAVYRDQLAEIDSEAERGLIGPEEAEAARREIARRLLAADSAGGGAGSDEARAGSRLPRMAALATCLLIPLGTIAIYVQTGAPGLPSQPLASRKTQPAVNPDLTRLIGAVEARLKQDPSDWRGWDVIAPVYLRLGRYAHAADAFERAAKLGGETAKRLLGVVEAVVLAEGGRVTPRARAALEALLRLEPANLQGRFWTAQALEQDGRIAEAVAAYEKLVADAPAGSEWRSALEERIAALDPARKRPAAVDGEAPPPAPAPGPSADDVAAAAQLSPADRQRMIEGMVAGLAERLDKNGRDLAGWERLVRALSVMGRKDDAVAALGKARKAFEGEPEPLAKLTELARSLGLGT
jgi:cytochrome c-type biogenesis protein CcmH